LYLVVFVSVIIPKKIFAGTCLEKIVHTVKKIWENCPKTTPELRTVSKMFPQVFFFPQKLGEIFLKAENLWQDIPFKFFELQFCKKLTTKETSACASFKFQCMLEWGLSIYKLESQLVREKPLLVPSQCMLEQGISIYKLESQLVTESFRNRMLEGICTLWL
jgi:hypothetical protein